MKIVKARELDIDKESTKDLNASTFITQCRTRDKHNMVFVPCRFYFGCGLGR